MYVLILSDHVSLPLDLCVTSALLGHAASTTRLSEIDTLQGPRPSLVLLDVVAASVRRPAIQAIRQRYPGVKIIALGGGDSPPDLRDDQVFWLAKPVGAAALRAVIELAGIPSRVPVFTGAKMPSIPEQMLAAS